VVNVGRIKIFVDGKEYETEEGKTLLDFLKEKGFYIPTLCYHPLLEPVGSCRLCVVEVEGMKNLQTSCTLKLKDGMKISTKSERVQRAVKTALALIRSTHPDDCQTCDANGSCELQDLLYRYNVENIYPEKEILDLYDDSSPAIIRDISKCVKCSRCVRVCDEIQGTSVYSMMERGYRTYPGTFMDTPVYDTLCTSCGQCSVVCPVGAIVEVQDWRRVLEELDKHDKVMVVQTAPAVRVAIAEEFGAEPGTISIGKMVAALRKLGFDYIFDTNFSADLTIVEEGHELVERIKNGGPFPLLTSCCPAWINMAEKEYPDFLENISSAKSPQGMMGAVVKTYFAQKIGKKPEDIFLVSVMPCTAKKDEALRKQQIVNGVRAIDAVITTRELAKLIKIKQIPFFSLEDDQHDDPLGESTGAAALFGVTGGVMEAALRTAYEVLTGETLPKIVFEDVRGLEGIKEAEVEINGQKYRVAVAHTLGNARKLLEKVRKGEAEYHFIEIMACPGGCIGGGGQPRSLDPDVLVKRANAIYTIDEMKKIRKSHENPSIKKLYEVFLEKPLSHIAHEILHTTYEDRSKQFKLVKVL